MNTDALRIVEELLHLLVEKQKLAMTERELDDIIAQLRSKMSTKSS